MCLRSRYGRATPTRRRRGEHEGEGDRHHPMSRAHELDEAQDPRHGDGHRAEDGERDVSSEEIGDDSSLPRGRSAAAVIAGEGDVKVEIGKANRDYSARVAMECSMEA